MLVFYVRFGIDILWMLFGFLCDCLFTVEGSFNFCGLNLGYKKKKSEMLRKGS